VDLIKQVIEAGTFAPSVRNEQQWRFTILSGKVKKDFTDFLRGKVEHLYSDVMLSCNTMERAPVLIVVWNAGEKNYNEAYSVAASIQNILLKAYSLGLGTVWIGHVLVVAKEIRDYFINSNIITRHHTWKLIACVALGWPDSVPGTKVRKSVEEVSEFLEN
jgi:nitroreductase